MKSVLRDIFLGIVLGVLLVFGIAQVNSEVKVQLDDFLNNWTSMVTSVFHSGVEKLTGDLNSILSTGQVIDSNETTNKGVSGSGYTFDGTYDIYYSLLSDNEKVLYAQIVANAESVIESFTPEVNGLYDLNVENAFQAVLFDHPELFWLDTQYSYKYLENGEIVEVDLKYNDLINDLENNKTLFNDAVNSIIERTYAYTSSYDKEKVVHDSLLELCDYDLNSAYNQTAYSALVNHTTVCAGYAKSFQYIMKQLGIPCYYVTGTSEGEDHAWNIVYIDGVWKNCDLTWDDAAYDKYLFFNKSDDEMSQTHTRSTIGNDLPVCY